MTMRRGIGLVVVCALIMAACGGSDDDADETTTTAGDTQVTTTTATPTTTGETTTTVAALGGLDLVRSATVQIVSTGTFIDPEEGQQANVAGAGSGFIIDESGIAVTNNHVVTGAAFIEVFTDGSDEPLNAKVLGVSECSDLAVIDIDGDGYPALSWFDGDATVGLDIYAAGFPLGDPEYTLLEGIVAKENVSGETNWASVDAVIEHSADTLPGNSGGPIITADGEVVAVNYAGNSQGQSFAIGRSVALPVIEELAQGNDVDSIGINGEAFYNGTFSGIWVSSVASGSPADLAGVVAGDIIVSLEDLILATDGTMSDYCDILRSRNATDIMAIEVYRQSTDEVLSGRLNSDPLVPSFSLATTDEVEADLDQGDADTGPLYDEYMQISDDTGSITVEVPAAWGDTNGSSWLYLDEAVGPALSAAPDLDAYNAAWDTPGVFIGASTVIETTLEEILDSNDFSSSCVFDSRIDYDDGFYTGGMDIWTDCGDAGSTFLVIAALPPDTSYVTMVQIVATSEADLAAADNIIRTYEVTDPQVPPN